MVSARFLIYLFCLCCASVSGQEVVGADGEVETFEECGNGSDIVVTSGQLRARLTSPGFHKDEPYAGDLHCSWLIGGKMAPSRVRITLEEMDIEKSRECQFDHLTIQFADVLRRGDIKNNRLCGTTGAGERGQVYEGVLPVEIEFISDTSVNGKGFSIVYAIPSPCDSNPCEHDSTCEFEAQSGSYTCTCKPGYRGRNCEKEILDFFTTTAATTTLTTTTSTATPTVPALATKPTTERRTTPITVAAGGRSDATTHIEGKAPHSDRSSNDSGNYVVYATVATTTILLLVLLLGFNLYKRFCAGVNRVGRRQSLHE